MALQGVQLLQLPLFGVTVLPAPVLLAMTILIVLISTNAVNFIDGLDGLAAGVVGIAALAFFAYSYLLSAGYNPPNVFSTATFITAALVGCCVGFLPHNFYPARLFMGDAGALLLGLLLAAATISMTGSIDPARVVSGNPTIAIYLPSCCRWRSCRCRCSTSCWRSCAAPGRASGRGTPTPQHLHHRMLQIGHTHRRAVLLLYLWAAARLDRRRLLRICRRLGAVRGDRGDRADGSGPDRVAAQVETPEPLVIPLHQPAAGTVQRGPFSREIAGLVTPR